MKHQGGHSFITDDQAEQMGADMAIQFMLMTLFQIVSGWQKIRGVSVQTFTANWPTL